MASCSSGNCRIDCPEGCICVSVIDKPEKCWCRCFNSFKKKDNMPRLKPGERLAISAKNMPLGKVALFLEHLGLGPIAVPAARLNHRVTMNAKGPTASQLFKRLRLIPLRASN